MVWCTFRNQRFTSAGAVSEGRRGVAPRRGDPVSRGTSRSRQRSPGRTVSGRGLPLLGSSPPRRLLTDSSEHCPGPPGTGPHGPQPSDGPAMVATHPAGRTPRRMLRLLLPGARVPAAELGEVRGGGGVGGAVAGLTIPARGLVGVGGRQGPPPILAAEPHRAVDPGSLRAGLRRRVHRARRDGMTQCDRVRSRDPDQHQLGPQSPVARVQVDRSPI